MPQRRNSPAPVVEVLLVDDHGPTRQEMCSLLESEADISIIAQSATAEDGLEKAQALSPSVVVMDLGLPGMNGLAATRHLQSAAPGTRVLVLSNHVGPDLVRLALRAGALGFVRKDRAFEELIEAVRAVANGDEFVGSGLGGE